MDFDKEIEKLNEEESLNSEVNLADDTEELLGKEPEIETSEDDTEEPESLIKEEEIKSLIFVVKVTTNKEEKALEIISDKIKKKNLNIYAIAHTIGLRGYIFLEAEDRENAEEAVFNLPYIKGIIPRVIPYSEIKPLLEPVIADIKIEKNDIIEIISDVFKKEKAKVVRVNKQKEEAVVSLLGAAVPITVTVKLDNIKVIRRDESEEIGGENS